MILLLGDCLELMKTIPDASIDSIVTDPPYGLSFMNKHWDYDVPSVAIWQEVHRVLKPGGHLLSFGGTRTYHRMVVNIEDAGFEIRDQIMWLYGSGFPKSQDISKAIDKQAGAEREVVGSYKATGTARNSRHIGAKTHAAIGDYEIDVDRIYQTAPATDAAKQWQGWGTALKPAWESICLARKPLTVADELDNLALECQSKLFVSIVRMSLASNQNGFDEVSNIAQWLAGKNTLTPEDSSALMDMLQSESARNLNLNTELSWLNTLAAISNQENTFTTETKSSLTIDLKILSCYLSKITLEDMQDQKQHGLNASVSTVEQVFNALELKLKFIRTLSVQESATSQVDLENLRPDSSPIVVARKPLEKGLTVAANVLKYGTGGLNIDASRVSGEGYSSGGQNKSIAFGMNGLTEKQPRNDGSQGRWPANLLLDEEAAAALDEQSGVLKSGKLSPNHIIKARTNIAKGSEAERHREQEFGGDSGGASRFFLVVKKHPLDTFSLCGQEKIADEDTCVGKKTENKSESSSTDISGSKLTESYLLSTTSITATETHSIIIFPILNACTRIFIGNITILSDKIIDSFLAESVEGVSVVSDTEALIDLSSGRQELIKGTVSIVLDQNSKNGEMPTERNTTPITESIASASRFRYVAKASKRERGGSTHPTMKPLKLMEYLVRLVTPQNGVVLDPFMGSGTTGVAAQSLAFDFIGIEMNKEYFEIAKRRMTQDQ